MTRTLHRHAFAILAALLALAAPGDAAERDSATRRVDFRFQGAGAPSNRSGLEPRLNEPIARTAAGDAETQRARDAKVSAAIERAAPVARRETAQTPRAPLFRDDAPVRPVGHVGCPGCLSRAHGLPYGRFQFVEDPACSSCRSGGESCGEGSCAPMFAPEPEPCVPGRDEWLCNGDDANDSVRVREDFTVIGLEPEDAIAHFDTEDGVTKHVRSNRVCLYAPRFAAVRKVRGLEGYDAPDKPLGVEQPQIVQTDKWRDPPLGVKQPQRIVSRSQVRESLSLRDRQPGLTAVNEKHLATIRDGFLPHEDFLLIRKGVFNDSEKARLAERILASLVWMSRESVQVTIDGELPAEIRDETGAGTLVLYDAQGKPRMRLCKVASKSDALPGEEVEFTLRFDNTGDEEIGNVTVLDSLPTRLEYVEGSAQCDLPHAFSTELNDAGSATLKWEINDPLPVGQGGIVRFKARVR